MSRIALFPGSFDPFTKGHFAIVERALPLFDRLIIAIGINNNKKPFYDIETRLSQVKSLYVDNEKVEVISYDTLTFELAQKYNADYVLRGVRSLIDFEYEKSIADANRKIAGLETIFMISDAETSHISSSLVREMSSFGYDISDFLP